MKTQPITQKAKGSPFKMNENLVQGAADLGASTFTKKSEKTKNQVKPKKVLKTDKIEQKENTVNKKKPNNNLNNVVDVCTIIKECSIDEISKYLLKQGKEKSFPDITTRQ